MTVYLPVRERALAALQAAFEGISTAAGYNTDVAHVYRKRDFPELAEDPPEIHLLMGEAVTTYRSTDCLWEQVPITAIFFLLSDSDTPDTEYNLFKCDLERVLGNTINDTSGTDTHEVQVVTDENTGEVARDRPLYMEAKRGSIIGRLDFTIQFSRTLTDPRLYDSSDTLVEG